MGFSWDDIKPFKGISNFVDAAKKNDAAKIADRSVSTGDNWRGANEKAHKAAGNPLNIRKKA
jgi:putative intracellular protease/amidase